MAYSAMCSAPDQTKPGARGTAAWAAGPEEAAAPKWRKTQPKQWRKKSFDWGSTRILGRKRYSTYTQHYSTTKCPVMLGLLPCFMASFFRAQVYPGLKFVMRIFANCSSIFSHPSSNNLQIFLVSFIWIFSNVQIQNCRKNMKESSRLIFPFGAHGGCACQGFLGLGSGQISAQRGHISAQID